MEEKTRVRFFSSSSFFFFFHRLIFLGKEERERNLNDEFEIIQFIIYIYRVSRDFFQSFPSSQNTGLKISQRKNVPPGIYNT